MTDARIIGHRDRIDFAEASQHGCSFTGIFYRDDNTETARIGCTRADARHVITLKRIGSAMPELVLE